MCQSGAGGIALVTGVARPRRQPGEAEPAEGGASPSKLSTELDVGLALDLIDVVNANPKDPDAPTTSTTPASSTRSCSSSARRPSATSACYASYPDSEWGKDAVWNASRNHYRFFNFDQAVKGYLTVAEDPKFAQSRAPQGGARPGGVAARQRPAVRPRVRDVPAYSDAIADKPQDSAQAYFFACNAYEKAQQHRGPQRLPARLHQEVRPAGRPPASSWSRPT